MRLTGDLSALLLVLVVVVVGAAIWLAKHADRPGPSRADTIVEIAPGDDVRHIALDLEKQGVIDDALLFEIFVLSRGKGGALRAGEYEMPAQVSIRGALALLTEGAAIARRLTVPEGLTSAQVAALVAARGRAGRYARRNAGGRQPASRDLPLHQGRFPRRHRRADAGTGARDAGDAVGGACGGPAVRHAGGSGGARLHRREGDGAQRRAGAGRRGVRQPPAPRHEAAIGPDRDLRRDGGPRPARPRPDARRPSPSTARGTPISIPDCRRDRSPIPARRRWKRRCTRWRPKTSISSPTAAAATPSRARSKSTAANVARWREIERERGDG